MPMLSEVYVATRTRNVADADSDRPPVLVLKRDDAVVFSAPLYAGRYLTARGAAGLFRFDVTAVGLDSADLDVQLFAASDDAWSPEHVLVWGVTAAVRDVRQVIPLAAFLDLASPLTPPRPPQGVWISGDASEGERILFLPRVGRGQDTTRARRLIVLVATEPAGGFAPARTAGPGGDWEETGTDGPITLQAGGAGRLLLSYTLPSTPQSDLEHGGQGFYIVDLAAPFGRADLEGGALTLINGGDDWWMPVYVAVFGVDTAVFGPNVLIPLVAAPSEQLLQMSSDSSEGWHSMVLPTAHVPPEPPRGGGVSNDPGGGVVLG